MAFAVLILAMFSIRISEPATADPGTEITGSMHLDEESSITSDNPAPMDLNQAILRNQMDRVEELLSTGESPVKEQGLETALRAGNFLIAQRLLACPDYSSKELASWIGGPRYLALACNRKAQPEEAKAQANVIRILLSQGASPEERLPPSDDESSGTRPKTARELAQENALGQLIPARNPSWRPCQDGPFLGCLTGKPLLPGPEQPLLVGPSKGRPVGGTFHPENARHSPEVGAGPFGYQFKFRPGMPYSVFVKGESPIPGVEYGIVRGVADRDGYTRFIRMPMAIPDEEWNTEEIVGELNAPYDHAFFVSDGEYEGRAGSRVPYSIESEQDGPVYFGYTDMNGRTVRMTSRTQRKLNLSLWDDRRMGGWCADQIIFKADCFSKRRGFFQKNLALIEDLFRESRALIKALSWQIQEESKENPDRNEFSRLHQDVSWSNPSEELEQAEDLFCFLRASRAAFLMANGRDDLAAPDIAHLVTCPNLSSNAMEPLQVIAKFLRGSSHGIRQTRILRAKAQAIKLQQDEQEQSD